MKVSIAIVSYNTRDYLRRCLESITATAGDIVHEVLVVDNGSHDGSADMVKADFPQARLIEPGENTFYSEGNNIAIRAARGEYVLILNPDTELHAGAMKTMLGKLEANPACGVVTAHQVWTDGKTTLPICSRFNDYADLWLGYTFFGVLLAPWRDKRRAHMWYEGWDRRTDRQVDVAPGSCLLARRELLLSLGGFDAGMPLYFSDDDLCKRVAAAGYEVWYAADATITHEESASLRQVRTKATRAYFNDLAAYTSKHFGPARAALLMSFATPSRWLLNLGARLRGA